MKDKVQQIREEVERLRKSFKVISVASPSKDTTLENIAKAALCRQILSFIDSMQEEPVIEDLVMAAIKAATEDMQDRQIMEESNEKRNLYCRIFRRAFKAGAQWQKKKTINKVVEWLKENVHKYADSFVDSFELCKDLKQIF